MATEQKRKIRWAISLFLVMLYFSGLPAQAQYGGGSGTAGGPYLIYTAEQMNTIGLYEEDWDKDFKLMADIDLAAYTGTDFNIIGYYRGRQDRKPFNGVFDGNGHTISNFSYTSTDVNSIALFGWVKGKNAQIKDLGLINPNVDAGTGSGVGSLVDYLDEGTVTGCYAQGGSVSGNEWVGGLVGYNSGTITNSYATGDVTGQDKVGGLVGYNRRDGSITTSYSTGTVSGYRYVDGLVGLNSNGTITNCYSSGDVINYSDWGGSGTEEDPYLIYTAEQMNTIGLYEEDWDKHFKLMADIDLAGFTGTDFNIIGYYVDWDDNKPFTGVFDGNGHTISNFCYISTDRDRVGLFGSVEGGTIKDLGLIDPNVDAGAGDLVGSLVGNIRGGTISNCYAEGANIAGNNSVGGLVGENCLRMRSTITNCYATGSVTGNEKVGGLVGENWGTIIDCYAAAIVSGINDVGGLVGFICCGTITNCRAIGTVTGGNHVGGLVGNHRGNPAGGTVDITIFGSYAYATVDGFDDVGGLVGSNHCTITDCYAFGDVTGTGWNVGGLVGSNVGTITQCYSVGSVTGTQYVGGLVGSGGQGVLHSSVWDMESSGLSGSAGGVGLTTVEMMDPYMLGLYGFANDPNWILDAGRDYPRLAWEGTTGQIIPEPNIDWLEGHGTDEYPYHIDTADQLILLGKASILWDNHFVLGADIDLDPNLPGQCVFGQSVIQHFTGVFDGNGHVISHLTITGKNHRGLFGQLGSGAAVSNLGLEAIDVNGTGHSVGGLVGRNYGNITNSYSIGTVSGRGSVGGLAGYNEGSIAASYSTGTVSGIYNVGGLVGDNGVGGRITESYSTGTVSGDRYVGGLVGSGSGSTTESFWDVETSGLSSSDGGIGKTTAEMKTAVTFLDTGWDFVGESINGTDDIWSICEGTNYPRLAWQIPAGDFVCPDGIGIEDFVFFIEHWGDDNCDLSNDYCQGTDLDFSGTVDEADFEILVENWLESSELEN